MSQRILHGIRQNFGKTGLAGMLLAAVMLAAGGGPAAMARPLAQPKPQPTAQLGAQDLFPDQAQGFLGVAVAEVTPDQAKELKLNGAYGVTISEVGPNTPAAKAGLKKGDVITEYNGMRVEGAAEFRRVVRETPPGHMAQITVWRDGHSEKLTAEIGSAPVPNVPNNLPNFGANGGPNGIPNGGPTPPYGNRSFGPRFAPGQPPALNGRGAAGATPALGVTAQNLTGQLGEYFGAPDGEGVLVTEVRQGSAGEKAGLKAGDVITKINGERVRNMAELRDHLLNARDSKSVTLGLIRKGAEMSLTAEIEMPQPRNPGTGQAPGPGLDRRIPL